MVKGVTVAFERDLRPEDAERIVEAIRQLRGVASVEAVEADMSADFCARERLRLELTERVVGALRPEGGEGANA